MTTMIPPQDAVDAIESGESYITRRIEIYEQDGETLWAPGEDDDTISRLVGGSISIDATRDERRTLDLVLENADNLLRPNPRDGFWYDKVIKSYRGVEYKVPQNRPRITIFEAGGTASAFKFLGILKGMGYTRSDVNLVDTDPTVLDKADILISYTLTTPTAKSAALQRHYNNGKSVMTISVGNTPAQVPHIADGTASGGDIAWGVTPVSTDTPMAGQWTTGASPDVATGYRPSGVTSDALAVAVWINGGGPTIVTASVIESNEGGRWFDLHVPNVEETHIKQLISAAIQWLQHYTPVGSWECQTGEFVIDRISDQYFPYQIKITGRDYTKRCLMSKLTRDVVFPAGTSVSELIRSLARNSGITGNMNVSEVGKYLTAPLAYASKTSRWEIMRTAANGVGYQLFFDQFGELTMIPFNDPVYDPTQYEFKTGLEGNLTSYERATSDVNLFNHIAVYGAASPNGLSYFGEAMNTDPGSPTNINEIGDRFYEYSFETVLSNTEASDLAAKFLKVSALETYEMNFGSICYPWLEVNTVGKILDPKAYDWEPDRYLISTAEIPFDLGPMSATGKRITQVGEIN